MSRESMTRIRCQSVQEVIYPTFCCSWRVFLATKLPTRRYVPLVSPPKTRYTGFAGLRLREVPRRALRQPRYPYTRTRTRQNLTFSADADRNRKNEKRVLSSSTPHPAAIVTDRYPLTRACCVAGYTPAPQPVRDPATLLPDGVSDPATRLMQLMARPRAAAEEANGDPRRGCRPGGQIRSVHNGRLARGRHRPGSVRAREGRWMLGRWMTS